MAQTDLNYLYSQTLTGDPDAEKHLFEALDARFRLFVRRRIRNTDDGNELVQNTLMAIKTEYKSTTISLSFAAWAYKVLDNRIMAYFKAQIRTRDRLVSIDDAAIEQSLAAPAIDFELRRQLMSCLERIGKANHNYAKVLNLKVQGHSTQEICAQMKITTTNLYSILSRARSMLERCLEKGEIN